MLPRRLMLLAGVLVLVVTKQMLVAARVYGRSMLPTLGEGDYLLGIRVPHHNGVLWQTIRTLLLTRGAIVLVRPPAHLGRLEVKRIDGIGGDFRSWGWDIMDPRI